MNSSRSSLRWFGAVALVASATMLAACTGTTTTGPEAKPSGEITVWTWSTNAADIAAMFEDAHPDIKVNLVEPGDGATTKEQLQTAFAAGSGAPDVAMVEYDMVLQQAMAGNIIPLTDYGIDEIKDDFADSIMAQLTVGGEVYGTPIDAAPLALFYRADLFDEAGIDVPATWDEFADAAETFRAVHPDSYITNDPFAEGGIQRLFWQTGVQATSLEGDTVAIDFEHPEYARVLDYWTDLRERGLTSELAGFSPDWNAGFADGTMASWIGAAWAPVILGSAAESSAGKWAVAPLPTWDGQPQSAEWGGSAYTVTSQSKNPAAAAEFVKWVNHTPEAYEKLFELTGSFPVLKEYINDAEFLATPFDFYGGQPINQTLAEALKTVPEWQWTPFTSEVNAVATDQFNAILDNGLDSQTALKNINTQLREYAAAQGFAVAD